MTHLDISQLSKLAKVFVYLDNGVEPLWYVSHLKGCVGCIWWICPFVTCRSIQLLLINIHM